MHLQHNMLFIYCDLVKMVCANRYAFYEPLHCKRSINTFVSMGVWPGNCSNYIFYYNYVVSGYILRRFYCGSM